MSEHKCILMLEDDAERLTAFREVVASLGGGYEFFSWRDADMMVREAPQLFDQTILLSLDHDLNPTSSTAPDPGTGLDFVYYLCAHHAPFCPVILHSSNYERVWSMHNELRFAGWQIERVGPLGTDWIQTTWQRTVRQLLGL